MYVFAGLAPVWKPMGMVYEYDPAGNQWTKKKPMALPSHHVAFTEYHGKIYAFGGFVFPQSGPPAWVPINNAWEYDPANDNWKAIASLPTKRGSAVAAVVGDKIYVIGGAANLPGSEAMALMPTVPQGVLGTVEEYDPAANTWRARSPMPTPRNHAAAGAVNGKIYVIGGRVGAAFIGVASDISVVEEYDPAMDKWSAPRARMPTTRSALGAGTYNGRIYVAGGEFQDPRQRALPADRPGRSRIQACARGVFAKRDHDRRAIAPGRQARRRARRQGLRVGRRARGQRRLGCRRDEPCLCASPR